MNSLNWINRGFSIHWDQFRYLLVSMMKINLIFNVFKSVTCNECSSTQALVHIHLSEVLFWIVEIFWNFNSGNFLWKAISYHFYSWEYAENDTFDLLNGIGKSLSASSIGSAPSKCNSIMLAAISILIVLFITAYFSTSSKFSECNASQFFKKTKRPASMQMISQIL